MSYSAQIKELFKKYGKVAIGVHLTIYAATLSGCYVAAKQKVKMESILMKYGLLSEEDLRGDAEDPSWLAKMLTSKGSNLAIAFLCTKALMPVRVPLTIGLTPAVARLLQRRTAEAASSGSRAASTAAAQEIHKRL